MINSLKRKKPVTASSTKNGGKKTRTVTSKAAKRTKQSSTAGDVDLSPKSLEHLIDRPYVEYDSQRDDIIFQILDCEDASKDKMALNGLSSLLVGADPSPLVRLHGCTDKGVSVVCLLQGLYPYLYFPISASFDEKDDTPRLLEGIKKQKSDVQIHKTEIVMREPLMYYRPNKEKYTRFIKIYCGSTTHQNAIARILEMSDKLPMLEEMMDEGKLYDLTVYETGLAYDMRTMVDLDIVGCGWAKVAKGKWKELPKTDTYKAPYERYGLAVVCQGKDVEGLSPTATSTDPERTRLWSKLAPFRGICLSTISLVESTGKPTISSKVKPNDDDSLPPTYIASIAMVLTASSLTYSPFDQTLLLTHSNTNIHPLSVSSTIHTVVYDSEKDMLLGFRDFLIKYDPDLLTGYDICEEISEIIDRAKELNLPKNFPYLARPSSTTLKPRSRQTYNASWVRAQRRMAGTSNREYIELGCTGRLVLDMRQVMEKEERLRTYSLNESCEHVLGRKLEYLSATTIAELLSSDEMDDKRRVADYAVKLAWTMLEIMRKNASLVSAVEMARVFGLNFQEVFMGQMRRMWGLLFRYSNARGVIVPGNSDTSTSQMTESPINWMPDTGYDTQRPIIVLDFKSLYPSIIIAKNLCFSTLLSRKADLPPDQIHQGYGPQECYFASADVKPGVLPAMLIHLLDERVKVKNLMKTTSDAAQKLVLDGRQRAIKVAANAVYGATGAPSSKLQCLPIAETTIVLGAKYLTMAKDLIQDRYSEVVDVVYGDTDSVFLRAVRNLSVPEAIELGDKISETISEEFPDPVFLEFEKVMFPSMLVNRKRYAGLTWTSPTQIKGVIDVKGIEGATRRDSVPIIAIIMAEIMDLLFPLEKNNTGDNIITDDERKKIIENVQKVIKISVRKILAGELDVGEFIMTRGLWLGTTSGDYKGKQAHIAVVDKVRKRDPRRVFKDGERVSYVLIQAPPNAKGFEKAEDPEYVITQGLSLDWSYYLEHTVKNPLSRILELLIPAKDIPSLFVTTARASVKKSFAGKNNAMSAFLTAGAKTLSKCIICGKKTSPGKKLCIDHEPLEIVIAAEKHAGMERLGGEFNLLEGACRSCQGNIGREVLCTNLDCGVYFKRMRAAGEFEEAREDFEGFISAQQLEW